MKKFILALILALGMAQAVKAQIAAVTITGLSNANYFPGQTVAVTIAIKNTNVFSQVNYDVLFSAATTASSTGYSSYLQGPMVCSGADDGFNFNSGIGTVNTVVRSVIVPSSGYSGHIVVIAAENSTFLTCSAATTYTTFTILNTPTPTNTATNTATSTVTHTPTLTPTATITNTLTNSPTATVTNTLTNTPTSTVTNTVTNTRTNTPSATPTITNTPYPTLSPVFLPVGGFNPSVTPQYFKTDSNGNLLTTSSGGSITVSGSTSITGGSLIAIPPTNTNTPTPTPTITGTITPTNTPTPIPMSRSYERNVVTWNPVVGVLAVFTPTSGLPFDGFLVQGKMASNALSSSGSATVQGLVDNGAGNFVAGFTSQYTTGTAGGTGFYIVPGAAFPTSPFSGLGLQIANYTPTPAVTPVVTVTILYRR